jgi:hypothetical protein
LPRRHLLFCAAAGDKLLFFRSGPEFARLSALNKRERKRQAEERKTSFINKLPSRKINASELMKEQTTDAVGRNVI